MPLALRPYETFLRVFEPASVHPEVGSEALTASRRDVEARRVQDADRRLLTLPIDPIPGQDDSAVLTLPPDTMGDGVLRVCPVQERIRSWYALDALERVWPESAVDLVAPSRVRRRVATDRAEWALQDREARVFTRTATWEIPLPWFVAVHTQEDQVDTSDGRLRVRVPVVLAQARTEWALDILVAKLPDEEITADMRELGAWFEHFDIDSVVELDYGGLADAVWPDTSSADVHDGIEALGEGDIPLAAACYHRYAKRWQRVAALARAS